VAGRKKQSDTYLRVSQIREKCNQLKMAEKQADMNRAKAEFSEADQALEDNFDEVTDKISAATMSAASLTMMSEALSTANRRRDDAAVEVERLTQPLAEARDALKDSSVKRKVAEKYVDNLKQAFRKKHEKNADRTASDRAGQVLATNTAGN
jgi:chromosome segregation ATPase